MDLATTNKAIILYVSLDNPLWARLQAIHPIEEAKTLEAYVLKVLGISPTTLGNWRGGATVSNSKAMKLFKDTLALVDAARSARASSTAIKEADELKVIVNRFSREYQAISEGTEARTHIYSVGKTLELSVTDTQMIIDRAIHNRRPLLQSVYFDAKSDAQRAGATLEQLGGYYYAWMRRGKGVWFQCPMRVRYLLDIKDSLFLRVKLNVPISGTGEIEAAEAARRGEGYPRWEYDGVLSARDRMLYWVFEKRSQLRQDFIYFITCRGRVSKGSTFFGGSFLTTALEQKQQIISDDVLLQRLSAAHVEEKNEKTDVMWKSSLIVDRGRLLSKVNELWGQYKKAR